MRLILITMLLLSAACARSPSPGTGHKPPGNVSNPSQPGTGTEDPKGSDTPGTPTGCLEDEPENELAKFTKQETFHLIARCSRPHRCFEAIHSLRPEANRKQQMEIFEAVLQRYDAPRDTL